VDEVAAEGVPVRRWDADAPRSPTTTVVWTMDFQAGRLNLWVERGIVVKACWF
jgi:hypothetical protein